jgi:hypothetical protein
VAAIKKAADDRDKFVGAAWEAHNEFWFKFQPNNPFLGIYDYTPFASFVAPHNINLYEDCGIDGIGKSIIDRNWAIVQSKFRGDPTYKLHYSKDHLANGISQAFTSGLFTDTTNLKNRVLFITTAAGMDDYTLNTAFSGNVRCLGNADISHHCDTPVFWEEFKRWILESQLNVTMGDMI